MSTMRWVYDQEVPSVPELVMVGSDDPRKALPLKDHIHPGSYEFVFVERGKASWEMDGALYETRSGDVFHTRPGEIHRGAFHVIEPCKFWWIILRAPEREDWLRLSPGEQTVARTALHALPRIIHTGLLPVEPFKQLQRSLQQKSEFRSMAVRQTLVQLLLLFLHPVPDERVIAEDLLRYFDRMIARIEREPSWRPTVQDLAGDARVSVSHFHRTFQSYTGFSPMSYLERSRIKEACRRLKEEAQSVTRISHELGYPSSQHFATVFKRHTFATPTEWRNRG